MADYKKKKQFKQPIQTTELYYVLSEECNND